MELKLKEELKKTSQKQNKLDDLLTSLKNQKENYENAQKEIISKLELEYYKAINEAKKGINLKDTKDKQRSINKANELKKAIKKPEFKAQNEIFEVGDYVKYGLLKGTISKLNKTDAIILTDDLSLRVPLKLLKKSNSKPINQKSKIKISIEKPQKPDLVLDLHGQRVEEALNNLDKFISDSLLMGFDEVIIKHGIGTGKLSKAVKTFLNSHQSVKSYRDGAPNEGGFGSKVVSL